MSADSIVSQESYESTEEPQALQSYLGSHAVSRVTTLQHNVISRISSIKQAIEDDHLQSKKTPQDLNSVLRDNLDVGDVIRMMTREDVLDKEAQSDEDLLTKVFTTTEGEYKPPPDGGYGWVSCFCTFLVFVNSWGSNSSFGVFLSYYLNNETFEGARKVDYALIAGITVFLGLGGIPFINIMMRFMNGKTILCMGIFINALGYILASFSTKLWQLYVCQGLFVGLGIPLMTGPTSIVVPSWFLKKRGRAMGLVLSGTGMGGVCYSLLVNAMIERTGNQRWALRVLAIMSTFLMVVATVLLKYYNPPPLEKFTWSKFVTIVRSNFNKRIVKMYTVNLILVWVLLSLFAYNLMIFSLAPYAVARGLTQAQASNATAILNASQTVGRPFIGFVSDRFGRVNTSFVYTIGLIVMIFAMWTNAASYGVIVAFAVLLGFLIGITQVMNSVLAADLVGPADFLPVFGWISLTSAPGPLICEVVALELVDKKMSNPYFHTQILVGCFYVCAFICVLLLRELVVRRLLIERQQETMIALKEENDHVLQQRQLKYEYLLGKGVKIFFMRMFYPVKV